MKKNILKKFYFLIYLVVVTFIIAEVAVRILTSENQAHVELFMNKKHRYLLPLPTEADKFFPGAVSEESTDSYRIFDDTLGWSHGTWGIDTSDFNCYSNNKGLRISKDEYDKRIAAKDHYDIIVIGNSFTHGDAVEAEDTWAWNLQQKTGKTVANLGVGGYGIQQALLRLMHSGITADTVIFGAIWGDLERAVDPVYTFYQGGNKTKPLIDFDDSKKGYRLINVPVLRPREFYDLKEQHSDEIFEYIPYFNESVFSSALWTKSYFLRLLASVKHQRNSFQEKPIYITEGEQLEYCLDIFELFEDYCTQKGMHPEIVLLDTKQNFGHRKTYGLDNPWELMKTGLENRKLNYLEFHEPLFEAFKVENSKVIHPVEGLHYSVEGNLLVCNLLIDALELEPDNNN